MANTNEIEDIQDIDETCGEEYVENFAPRAQEETLIEIQDNNQNDDEQVELQSERNEANEDIISKNDDHLEYNEASNEEELQETSDQLIKEVITDAELNLNEEEEFHATDDNNIDNSQDSETNIEIVNSDDKNVDVEMQEQTDNIQKFEQEPEETDNVNDESNVSENIQDLEQEPEEAENINDESNMSELKENVEECDESKLEPQETERENVDINETKPIEIDCVKQTEVVVSPIKGKDVKSLSSTYGREENLTNGDCCICNKIVYPMEKLSTNDRLYHKTCFRCTKCKNALSTGNFTFNQGKPYCTPHYVELFKKRGRYDEIDNNTEAEHSIVTDNNENVADEMPAPDTTKNMLAKFQNLQSNAGSNTNSTSLADSPSERPQPNTTKNLAGIFSALGQEKPEMKCKPKIDIPRQSNGHTNGSSENEPVVLPKDVIRSNEPGQDDKPEQGITKNLVNRFRELESGSTN